MSIYPVYLARWFPNPTTSKKSKPDWMTDREELHLHEMAKMSVKYSECHECGGKCEWKKAWGHHSLPWGHGDVWCSKKCLYGEKK